jgi:hypothetical protein
MTVARLIPIGRGQNGKQRPMSLNRLRSRRTADRMPDWKAPPYRDIQMKIGEGLMADYEPPKELPYRWLTLLVQMNEQSERTSEDSTREALRTKLGL